MMVPDCELCNGPCEKPLSVEFYLTKEKIQYEPWPGPAQAGKIEDKIVCSS